MFKKGNDNGRYHTGISKKLHTFFEAGGEATAKELIKMFNLKYYRIHPILNDCKKYYLHRHQSFGVVKPDPNEDGVYKLLSPDEVVSVTVANLKRTEDVTRVNLRFSDVSVENNLEMRELVFRKINDDVKLISSYLEKWTAPQLEGDSDGDNRKTNK